jgi:hypothetical protein
LSVSFLLRQYPCTLNFLNFGQEYKESWNNLLKFLNGNEGDIDREVEEYLGNTPLHVILQKNPPLDIVLTFITNSPKAVEVQNEWKVLPIHVACLYKALLEVMKELIKACPEGLKVEDSGGLLPIHMACGHDYDPFHHRLF